MPVWMYKDIKGKKNNWYDIVIDEGSVADPIPTLEKDRIWIIPSKDIRIRNNGQRTSMQLIYTKKDRRIISWKIV